MFGSIKAFISRAIEDVNQRKNVEQRELLIDTAALLIRVATVHNELSDIRRARLHAILKSQYGLDDTATAQLLVDADAVARSAVDLYRFTRQLNESLDDDGRRRIVQLMWEVVYADQRVNEFEENLIWRAADLLGVSSRQRVELRQRVVAGMKSLATVSA
ncbi:TerB family tellurite resistance protein [Tardiphaga sp. 813_E8_N1_3]|uniref:tellurite resistance TerB family protein n=1 Tax=Tardiphaga sp. 813_E8_N1_3 TaxID=3240760 RepID=UPI003F27EA3B